MNYLNLINKKKAESQASSSLTTTTTTLTHLEDRRKEGPIQSYERNEFHELIRNEQTKTHYDRVEQTNTPSSVANEDEQEAAAICRVIEKDLGMPPPLPSSRQELPSATPSGCEDASAPRRTLACRPTTASSGF